MLRHIAAVAEADGWTRQAYVRTAGGEVVLADLSAITPDMSPVEPGAVHALLAAGGRPRHLQAATGQKAG